MPHTTRLADELVRWRDSAPFVLFHFVPLLVLFTGVTTRAVVLAVVLYVSRAFFITAGYHRYFAHKTYSMGRIPQFLMAFGGSTAVQRGPLWWAAHHRDHHRYADTERDPHTPLKGFWWSHMGWILSGKYSQRNWDRIEDFAAYPELRFIDRHDWIGPWFLGVVSFLIAGWSGLLIGFFLSTILLWHATFSVNSFAHIVGRRRYATTDTSRNSPVIAVLTLGEGWHNNHHHYPMSARQGFRWWEIDVSYYVLRVLAALHIVRDLRQPTEAAKAARRLRSGQPDVGLVRYHLTKTAERITRPRLRLPPELARSLSEDLSAAADRASAAARNLRTSERPDLAVSGEA